MTDNKQGRKNDRTSLLWEKARRLGLKSIKGLTLDDDIQMPEELLVAETVEEPEADQPSGIEVGDDNWEPEDPTKVIHTKRPELNDPKVGYRPPGKRLRWCTDLQRSKTGMQHWQKVSRKEEPDIVPVDHPITTSHDGAQDQYMINDAYLCQAPIEEVTKRQKYYKRMDEERMNRHLYESHRQAQREGGSPGIVFRTGKVAHETVSVPIPGKKKVSVSVPAQIK